LVELFSKKVKMTRMVRVRYGIIRMPTDAVRDPNKRYYIPDPQLTLKEWEENERKKSMQI
jgi:hypothetical protein